VLRIEKPGAGTAPGLILPLFCSWLGSKGLRENRLVNRTHPLKRCSGAKAAASAAPNLMAPEAY